MVTEKPYYPNLEAEISKNGIKKQDIAEALSITPRAFSLKMKGQVGKRYSLSILYSLMYSQ